MRYATKQMLGLETLPSLVRAAAERYGARPAYVEKGKSLSFTSLLARVEADRGGVRRGGRRPR